jgi:hypothetical protein
MIYFQAAFTLAAFILTHPTETPHAVRWNLMWVEEVHDLIDRLTFGIADEAFRILEPRSKGQSNV